MTTGLLEIALLIGVAAVLGIIAKFLKQPVILAYLASGLLIGHFGFFNPQTKEIFGTLSELGIMFLLFLVGLEINYSSLRLVGKSSVIIGLSQIFFTGIIGWVLASWLGFSLIPSLYIGVALTFSSTVIVVKLLSDKKDSNSLYGKITIGALLIQDFFVILLLILLAGIFQAENQVNWTITLIITLFKGIALFGIMLWLGRKILPYIFDKIARSQELLFLLSLAWLFLLAAVISKIGFSVEIAGFLAGLALANSSENYQISSRIRPLRDFFIMIFFVVLGSSIVFSDFGNLLVPIIVFSLFVLIGTPLIVTIIMGLMGYRKRTGFLTGLAMAQISEFSFVLAAMGLKIGHLDERSVALIAIIGIITIAISSYMIVYSDNIYRVFRKILNIFERKHTKEKFLLPEGFHRSVVLIGCHRIGQSLAANLPKEKLLIIDFDPDVIDRLKRQGYVCLFGDISDEEILETSNLEEAELVISTSPHLEDSLTLLGWLSRIKNQARIIVRAETEEDAHILYRHGADYVILPEMTSGQYLGKTIAINPSMDILEGLRKRDQALMKQFD
ncbi:MAG: cation:proton antiporter [bacterium]|nr:cation:proton antiporter [bacterium]